jgi:prepilin signal peptidase PulO-like enzyme (type II secretory pathway)
MHIPNPAVKIAIGIVSSFLFIYSFKLNEFFDSFALYAPGINLIFIPAGIKLLCILIGGEAAAIGLLISNVYVSMGVWDNTTVLQMVYFAFTSVGTYYLIVRVVKKLMGIDDTLRNLRYMHIVILSAVAAITNGTVHNVIYVWQDKVAAADFLAKSTAMAFGDFLGCFVVIIFCNFCIDMVCKLVDSKQQREERGIRLIAQYLN